MSREEIVVEPRLGRVRAGVRVRVRVRVVEPCLGCIGLQAGHVGLQVGRSCNPAILLTTYYYGSTHCGSTHYCTSSLRHSATTLSLSLALTLTLPTVHLVVKAQRHVRVRVRVKAMHLIVKAQHHDPSPNPDPNPNPSRYAPHR